MACPLCTLSVVDAQQLWYHRASGGAVAAQSYAATTSAGALPLAIIRRHFDYHRPTQPAPAGQLKPKVALAQAQELSPRKQGILLALSRAAPLNTAAITDMLYGDLPNRTTAMTMANRDLRALMWQDFVYAWYPSTKGKAATTVLYWPARDAAPWLRHERGEGRWQQRLVTSIESFDKARALSRWNSHHGLLQLLQQQATVVQWHERAWTQQPLWQQWWTRPDCDTRFRHPLLGTNTRLRIDGIMAVAWGEYGGQARARQWPFAYIFDSGSSSATVVAKNIVDYVGWSVSDQVTAMLPQLPTAPYFLPLLVVCPDAQRKLALQAALDKWQRELGYLQGSPVLVGDLPTMQAHDWLSPTWDAMVHFGTWQRQQSFLDWLAQASRACTLVPEISLQIRQRKSTDPAVVR